MKISRGETQQSQELKKSNSLIPCKECAENEMVRLLEIQNYHFVYKF